jgi:hypothetical protein
MCSSRCRSFQAYVLLCPINAPKCWSKQASKQAARNKQQEQQPQPSHLINEFTINIPHLCYNGPHVSPRLRPWEHGGYRTQKNHTHRGSWIWHHQPVHMAEVSPFLTLFLAFFLFLLVFSLLALKRLGAYLYCV